MSNFDRMIQLADEVFASKSDPNQLDVNPKVLDHLRKIHPNTVCELENENGPIAWVLLIPTTTALMNQFLKNEISEKELYKLTPTNTKYEALYLCSAMVLKEYRRKGIAKQLTLDAVKKIREDHPIKSLFVWTFSKEGFSGAKALAKLISLPLFIRIDSK